MSRLELSGLTKSFGGLVAVDGLDMSVNPGEIHGLIGPNGSGKSTTLNLVSGLYQATKGRVLLDGQEITHLQPPARTALGMARTFQNIRLFRRMSVLSNVMVGQYCRTRTNFLDALLMTPRHRQEERATRTVAEQALDIVGMSEFANENPTDLPYGRQRLVEIARALATGAKLLLLDEPAAGMNPSEKQDLQALIQRINRELGLTIVLIEHDMGLVMSACHRITVLNFGARIASGTADEVRSNAAVIEAYLGKGGRANAAGE